MSPHRLSDFVPSESGSSTPVLVDGLSDMERSGSSSPTSEEAYKTGYHVNEPIAIIGIGQYFEYQPIYDLLMSQRLSASRRC